MLKSRAVLGGRGPQASHDGIGRQLLASAVGVRVYKTRSHLDSTRGESQGWSWRTILVWRKPPERSTRLSRTSTGAEACSSIALSRAPSWLRMRPTGMVIRASSLGINEGGGGGQSRGVGNGEMCVRFQPSSHLAPEQQQQQRQQQQPGGAGQV